MSLIASAAKERKRQLAVEREIGFTRDVSAISFVVMAQSELIDEVTITENAELFVLWDGNWRGKAGSIVRDEGRLYRSIHDVGDGQNAKPSETPSMWTPIGNPAEEYPAWSAPLGGHDAYMAGAKVSHRGKRWSNVHGDGNVWEPGVYGWTEIV